MKTRSKTRRRDAAAVEMLEERRYMALYNNDIDSLNLGKGMWGWNLTSSMTAAGQGGSTASQKLTNYFTWLKNTQGVDYFITKAGDGSSQYSPTNSPFGASTPQYNSTVVSLAHAAGIKIFPYFFIYGNYPTNGSTVANEISVFNTVMDTHGGDGAVLDIENQYGGLSGDATELTQYFQGIGRTSADYGTGAGSRDKMFLAYSSFAYIQNAHQFDVPWAVLNDYSDSAWPQVYWHDFGTTYSIAQDRSDTDYKRTSIFGTGNIKPVIPTGQSYGGVPESDMTAYHNYIVADTNAVGPNAQAGFRYKSINWFDEASTTAAGKTAIAATNIGDAPGVTNLLSPANGQGGLSGTGIVLDWSDVVNTYGAGSVGAALHYDIYVELNSNPGWGSPDGTVSYSAPTAPASTWTIPGTLSGGTYKWKVVARNMLGSTESAVRTFSIPVAPPPAAPVLTSPAIGQVLTSKPYTLDWEDSANATGYDLYFFASTNPASPAPVGSTWTSSPIAGDANYTWHVNAKNNDFTTVGANWTFTLDTVAPTSTLSGATPTTGAAYLDFNITYTDATSGILVSTLDSNDITVTGPSGAVTATFQSVNNPANGSPRIATYRMFAPGGFWNDADNGTYTIAQVAGQVTDRGGLPRAAGTIGTYNFTTLGYSWLSGSTLNVAFDGTATAVALSTNGANVRASKNASNADYPGVTAISILGTNADDRLQINAPLTPPVAFDNSAGNDLLEVTGGTYTFASDIATPTRNLGIYVAGPATAVFNSSQHLRSLSVDGTATLSAGGSKLLWVKDLQVTGQLNLTNNSFAWDYTGGTQIGAWATNAYNGVHGKIADGRAAGNWTGNGLITDQAGAMGDAAEYTLAVAEASSALGIASGATGTFNSETVDGTTVLVRYTFASDVNLSSSIDGDDYWYIDNNYNNPAPLYERGDFDLNGRMDSDDYWLIDTNYVRQFV